MQQDGKNIIYAGRGDAPKRKLNTYNKGLKLDHLDLITQTLVHMTLRVIAVIGWESI
jgi:hypothetical protein